MVERRWAMWLVPVGALVVALFLGGCRKAAGEEREVVRRYSATATVGDFFLIEIHPESGTMILENRTTSEMRTATYTIADDGAYLTADPLDQISLAYEMPGFALVAQGAQMGPAHDQRALVVALNRTPLTRAELFDSSFAMLQFRTREGGIEVGHIGIDEDGTTTNNMYQPALELAYPGGGFLNLTFEAGSLAVDNPELQCVQYNIPPSPLYIFGSASGAT